MELQARLIVGVFCSVLWLDGCKSASPVSGTPSREDSGIYTTRPNDDASDTRADSSVFIQLPDAIVTTDATLVGCQSGPNDDNDKDGYTVAQGDCNDCDPNTNPGAYDVAAATLAPTAWARPCGTAARAWCNWSC